MVNRFECYHCIEVYENILDKLKQLKLDLGDLENNIKTLRYMYSGMYEEKLILPPNFEKTVTEQIKTVEAHIRNMERKYRDRAYRSTFSEEDWEIVKSIDLDITYLRANLRFMEAIVNERTEGSCVGLSASVLESTTEGIVGRQKVYQAADAVAQYFFAVLGMQWNGACCFTMEPYYSILTRTHIVNLPPFAESRTRFWTLIAHEACHEKIEDAVMRSVDSGTNGFCEFLELIFDLRSSLDEYLPNFSIFREESSEKNPFYNLGPDVLMKIYSLDNSNRYELRREIGEYTRQKDKFFEKLIFSPESPFFSIVEILVDILASEITGMAYLSAILCYVLHPYDLRCECPPSSVLRGTAIMNTLRYIKVFEDLEANENGAVELIDSAGFDIPENIGDEEINKCLLRAWESYIAAQKKIYPDTLKEETLGKIDWESVIERLNRIVFPGNTVTGIEQKEKYSKFNDRVNWFLTEYMEPRKLPPENIVKELNPAVVLNAVWKLRMKRSITKLYSQGERNDSLTKYLRQLEIKGTHLATFTLYKWHYQTYRRYTNV